MKNVDIEQLALPPGTQGWKEEASVSFTFMWQSPTGQHCVIMKLPAAVLDNARFTEELEASVVDFNQVVALEILSDQLAGIET